MPKKIRFKVAIVGPPRVGKSSLVHRIHKSEAPSNLDLIQKDGRDVEEDIVQKTFTIKNTEVILEIWDAVGQEGSWTPQFYRNSLGIILLFDSTDAESLAEVSRYQKKSESVLTDVESSTYFLVATKCDHPKSEAENIEYGKMRAKLMEFEFYECDAMTGRNVELIFENMATRLLQKKQSGQIPGTASQTVVNLQSSRNTLEDTHQETSRLSCSNC